MSHELENSLPVEPSQELLTSVRQTILERTIDGHPTYRFPSITINRHNLAALFYDQTTNTYYHVSIPDAHRKGLFRRGEIVSEEDGTLITTNSDLDIYVDQIIPEGNDENEELSVSFHGTPEDV